MEPTLTLNLTRDDIFATRVRIAHLWPTPEQLYALQFGVTEAGEARLELLLDALLLAFDNCGGDVTLPLLQRAFVAATRALDHGKLRTDPRFNRNHTRLPDFRKEVADMALMVLTAQGPDFNWPSDEWCRMLMGMDREHVVDNFGCMARLLAEMADTTPGLCHVRRSEDNLHALMATALHLVPDLRAAVQERLARIEARVTAPLQGAPT